MKGRLVRTVVASCAVVGLFAAAPGRASAGDASPTSSDALKACIDEHRALSVLFLVDTSGSLAQTDPSSQRVTGLKLAVSSLQSLRAAKEQEGAVGGVAGKPFPVYVDFLSFGTGSHRSFDGKSWTELPASAGAQTQLFNQIERFRNDQRGADTDYVSALNPNGNSSDGSNGQVGALGELKGAPKGSCRLMVWFTDGQFDFDPSLSTVKHLAWAPNLSIRPYSDTNFDTADVKGAVKQGRSVMCSANGLVDRLRKGSLIDGEGAVTAVVALGSDASKFDLIQGIAENTGPAKCGHLAPRGSLYRAEDVNALIFSLQKAVLGTGNGLDGQGIDTCSDGKSCSNVDLASTESYDYPFTLSPGVSTFNLLALEGDAAAVDALLVSPNGETVTLDDLIAPQAMRNHSTVTVTSYPESPGVYSVSTQLSGNPDEWQGQWRVRFVSKSSRKPTGKNRASLYVFAGSLNASLRETTVFRRSRTGKIVIQLKSSVGTTISSPADLPHPELDLKVNGKAVPTGNLHPDGTWEIDYPVSTDERSQSLELSGTLRAMVQVDKSLERYELASWNLDHLGSIEIRDLPKYPTLDDPIAPFNDSLSQKRSVISTSLQVIAGKDEGAGCVTLADVTQPESDSGEFSGDVKVLSDGHELVIGKACGLKLESGQSKKLDIEVSIPKKSIKLDTILKGSLTFSSVSAKDPTQSAPFTKTFSASVAPVFDVSVDRLRALVLIVGALLLALLVLYGLNLLFRKLEVGVVAVATLPVRFDGRQFTRFENGSGSPLEIKPSDIDVMNAPHEGSHRTVSVGMVEFKGHVSASPFSAVSGRARRTGAAFNVANRGASRKGRLGILDAALKEAWLFSSESLPQADGDGIKPLDGSLTLVVPPDLDDASRQLDHLRRDIEEMVERRCEDFKVEVPASTPPPATVVGEAPTPKGPWDSDIKPPSVTPDFGGLDPVIPTFLPPDDPFGGSGLGTAPPQASEPARSRFRRRGDE